MDSKIFVDIMLALIVIIGSVVSAFVIPWLKSKMGEQEFTKLIEYVKLAVRCADQIFIGDGRGAEKKEYVMNYVKNIIDTQLNIKLSDEQLSTIVEGFVNQIHSLI